VRNHLNNTTNYKESTNIEKLVLVRSAVLFGLMFEEIKQEKITYNSGITSVPTFIYFNNNTECFIDFSNKTNLDIETKLKVFFSKVNPLTTFFVNNAYYEDTTSDINADLSGEYVFNDFYNGIVKATVTSVTGLASGVTRYDKKYFQEIPIINMSSIPVTEVSNVTIVRNIFGINTKNSFSYLGLKLGDFISFSNADNKYEILEISNDPNGVETIKIKGKIPRQDKLDTKILVNVFAQVKDKYTVGADLSETETGACVISNNGIIISCYDNHTRSQCRFRSSAIDSLVSTFGPESFCFTQETDTAVELSTTDQLVQITNLLTTSLLASNASNVVGPVNRGGNSRTSYYGR
jgi:hypothetical protein